MSIVHSRQLRATPCIYPLLTEFCLQHLAPGCAKEANWLPYISSAHHWPLFKVMAKFFEEDGLSWAILVLVGKSALYILIYSITVPLVISASIFHQSIPLTADALKNAIPALEVVFRISDKEYSRNQNFKTVTEHSIDFVPKFCM